MVKANKKTLDDEGFAVFNFSFQNFNIGFIAIVPNFHL